MKLKNNAVIRLSVCVLVLLALCIMSVVTPMRFEKELKQRETVVKERMQLIRQAEQQYLKRHGVYTGRLRTLVQEGLLADSLQYIPYTDKKPFDLSASIEVTPSGRNIPMMECRAPYHDYLSGLNENSVANLIEDANDAGQYPGLVVRN